MTWTSGQTQLQLSVGVATSCCELFIQTASLGETILGQLSTEIALIKILSVVSRESAVGFDLELRARIRTMQRKDKRDST